MYDVYVGLCTFEHYMFITLYTRHEHTSIYIYNIVCVDCTPMARKLQSGGGGGEQTFRRRQRHIVNDVTVGTYNPIINDIADLKPVIKSNPPPAAVDDRGWKHGGSLSVAAVDGGLEGGCIYIYI